MHRNCSRSSLLGNCFLALCFLVKLIIERLSKVYLQPYACVVRELYGSIDCLLSPPLGTTPDKTGLFFRHVALCSRVVKSLVLRGSPYEHAITDAWELVFTDQMESNRAESHDMSTDFPSGAALVDDAGQHALVVASCLQTAACTEEFVSFGRWPCLLHVRDMVSDAHTAQVVKDGALVAYLADLVTQRHPTAQRVSMEDLQRTTWAALGCPPPTDPNTSNAPITSVPNNAGTSDALHRLLGAAVQHFMGACSVRDVSERTRWLAWLVRRLPPAHTAARLCRCAAQAAEHLLTCSAMTALVASQQTLAHTLGLDDGYLTGLPWDVATHAASVVANLHKRAAACNAAVAVSAHLHHVTMVRVAWAGSFQTAREHDVYADVADVHNLNLMQQSYLLANGRISEARLTHPIARYMYAFVTEFDHYIVGLLTLDTWESFEQHGVAHATIDAAWELRVHLWLLCAGQVLVPNEDPLYVFRLLWTQLTTTLDVLEGVQPSTPHMRVILRHMHACTAPDAEHDAAGALPHTAPPWSFSTFRSAELFSLYQRLLCLREQFDMVRNARSASADNLYSSAHAARGRSTATVLEVGGDDRRKIVEGLCTVLCMDASCAVAADNFQGAADDTVVLSADQRALVELIDGLATRIEHTLCPPTAPDAPACTSEEDADETHVEDVAPSLQYSAELWPLQDYVSMCYEHRVLPHMLRACGAGGSAAPAACVGDARALVDMVSENAGGRPPHDFTPYLHLVWLATSATSPTDPASRAPHRECMADGGNENSATCGGGADISHVVGAMLQSWHQRTWMASYDDELVSAWLERSAGKARRADIAAQTGPAALTTNVLSQLMRTVVDVQRTAVAHVASKIEQATTLERLVHTAGQLLGQHSFVEADRWMFVHCTLATLRRLGTLFPDANTRQTLSALLDSIVAESKDPGCGSDSTVAALRDALLRTTESLPQDDALRVLLTTHCVPVVHALERNLATPTASTATECTVDDNTHAECTRALAWVHLGQCVLQISTPTTPTDPAGDQHIKLVYKREELRTTDVHLEAASAWARRFHGTVDTPQASRLARQHVAHVASAGKISEAVVVRPVPSQYPVLRASIRSYTTKVCPTGRVLDVAQRLHAVAIGTAGTDALGMLQQQEVLLQANQEEFSKKMHESFPMYPDVTQSIAIGVQHTRHGLRLLSKQAEDARYRTTMPLTTGGSTAVVATLARLPRMSPTTGLHTLDFTRLLSPEATAFLRKLDAHQSGSGQMPLYPRVLHTVTQRLRHCIVFAGEWSTTAVQVVTETYQAYANCWEALEQKRITAEAERQSLYKHKTTVHCEDTEEAAAEREFKRLFPTFASDFQDLVDNVDNDSANVVQEHHMPEEQDDGIDALDVSLPDAILSGMFQNFLAIFNAPLVAPGQLSPSASPGADCIVPCNRETTEEGYNAGVAITSAALVQCTSDLDRELLNAHFYFSGKLRREIDQAVQAQSVDHPSDKAQSTSTRTASGQKKSYNIYRDANVAEAQLVTPVLLQFKAHANNLLEQFHDHPTLVQLVTIVDRILAFPATSPLMKFLTGLDLLLSRADDWQRVAHKGVSLQDSLDAVTVLVVRWRKLELKRWPAILDVAAEKVAAPTHTLWFSIYKVLTGVPEAFDIDGVAAYLCNVHQCVDLVFQKATIGDFTSRLELIRAFAAYTRVLSTADVLQALGCSSEDAADVLASLRRGIADVVMNLYVYYKQFSSAVSAEIDKARAPLTKDLKAYVKIARWKDTTYAALKSSGATTHKKLHGIARKFEAALRQAVTPIYVKASTPLANQSAGVATEDSSGQPEEASTSHPTPVSSAAAPPMDTADDDAPRETTVDGVGELVPAIPPVAPAHASSTTLADALRAMPSGVRDAVAAEPAYGTRMLQIYTRLRTGVVHKVAVSSRVGRTDAVDAFCTRVMATVEWLQGWFDAQERKEKDKQKQLAEQTAASSENGSASSGGSAAKSHPRAFSDKRTSRDKQGVKNRKLFSAMLEPNNDTEGDDEKTKKDLRKHAKLMKQNALAMFLKALANSGLSYRVVQKQDQSMDVAVTLPFVDMDAVVHSECGIAGNGAARDTQSTSTLPSVFPLTAELDSAIRGCWERVQQYHVRILSRMSALREAIVKPHDDLTRVQVAKCIGFAEHLFSVHVQQRRLLADICDEFQTLRYLSVAVGDVGDVGDVADVGGGLVHAVVHGGGQKELIDGACALLQDVSLLADACVTMAPQATPADTTRQTASVALQRATETVQATCQTLKTQVDRLTWQQRARLSVRGCGHRPVFPTASMRAQQTRVDTACATALASMEALAPLADTAGMHNASESVRAYTVEAATRLAAPATARASTGTDTSAACEPDGAGGFAHDGDAVEFAQEYISDYNTAIKHMLKATLAVSKLDIASAAADAMATEDEAAEHDLQRGHLLALHREFVECFRTLNLQALNRKVERLGRRLADAMDVPTPPSKDVVDAMTVDDDAGVTPTQQVLGLCATLQAHLTPVLQCFFAGCHSVFVQFLEFHKSVCKMQYVSSGIFLDLCLRGYCTPADEGDGDGDDGHAGDDLQGTGMAEGTGKKDVSDQIEDEEQVGVAHGRVRRLVWDVMPLVLLTLLCCGCCAGVGYTRRATGPQRGPRR